MLAFAEWIIGWNLDPAICKQNLLFQTFDHLAFGREEETRGADFRWHGARYWRSGFREMGGVAKCRPTNVVDAVLLIATLVARNTPWYKIAWLNAKLISGTWSWSYKQIFSVNLIYAHFRALLLVEILMQPMRMLKIQHSMILRWKYLYRFGPRKAELASDLTGRKSWCRLFLIPPQWKAIYAFGLFNPF